MYALPRWSTATTWTNHTEKYRFWLLPRWTRIWLFCFCHSFPRGMERKETQHHRLSRVWRLCGSSNDCTQCDRHRHPPHQWCFWPWSGYAKPLPLHGKTQQACHFPCQSTWPRELRLRHHPRWFANHLWWESRSRAISFGNRGWIQ